MSCIFYNFSVFFKDDFGFRFSARGVTGVSFSDFGLLFELVSSTIVFVGPPLFL